MAVELTLLPSVSFRGREITGARLRGLLALLAADLRAGCGTARLVAGLWPDEQPAHPAKALQVLVSRARALLGADVVVSTATGYRLALTEDQVDAAAVLRHASESDRCADAGDHTAALAHAEEGLRLWDGAEGQDQEPGDPVSALRADRQTAYLSLVRARALALSRSKRHTQAFGPLRDLAAARPRDEEVLTELLRCETTAEGPAAALERYEAYRRALREEVGTEPGAALRSLHQELLAHDAPVVRRGLRHEPNRLLGRDDDLAAVSALLRTSRVTSVVGAGGLGKTRLAHAVSRQATQRVVQFVGLAGLAADAGAAEVAGEVASALGVGDVAANRMSAPQHGIVEAIVTALDAAPALLVLDNCEHVVRGVADLVHALVSLSPDLRVLTTSRAPLGLSAEAVYQLPELDLPTMTDLFTRRARAARPDAALPEDVVRPLCERLDGLPLAAELAAARVRVMSVHEISRRLDDRFALLRGSARDAPQRHRTLHAVIDWSWHLLTPGDQAALRALSIFPDGFAAEAALVLLGDDSDNSDNSDNSEVLERLTDQSLLKVTDTGEVARFRMLETVREFSAARREETGETDAVVGRFLLWGRGFAVAHHDSLLTADLTAATRAIKVEQDNLVQALRHALGRDDGATVAATTAVLGTLWVSESNMTRLIALAEEAAWLLSHLRPEPDLLEPARTAAVLCAMSGLLVRGSTARRSLVTLRRLPAAAPDTPIRAAQIALCAPDVPALLALCESDQPMLAGTASYVASFVWEQAGEPGRALAAARHMLACVVGEDEPMSTAVANARVGELCLDHDPGEPAYRHLHAALAIAERLGWWSSAAQARWALVLASLQCGALDEAERRLDEALRDDRELPAGTRVFDVCARAQILLGRGDVERGLELWRHAAHRVRAGATAGTSWPWQVQAVAVVAHARHGRLGLVADVLGELPDTVSAMVANPSLVDLRVCGSVLLALGVADLHGGAAGTGVRFVALAHRFGLLRSFHPTMALGWAKDLAEQTDGPAYSDAVSDYVGLDREGLRAAALTELRARELSGSAPA